MKTKSSIPKHSRPILWFAAVLLISLAAADVVIVSQQRKMLMDIRQNDVRNELDIMGTLVREALLKKDYRTVEDFLTQWGKEHKDVLGIRAITPNGFVLAEYKSVLPARRSFPILHKVYFDEEYLITLELVKDFSNIDKNLDEMSFKLIGGSIIFIALLGFFLWYTVNTTAMKPLQKEIAERKKAEEALKDSNEFSKTILNSMNDSISIINADDFKIVAVNKVFLQEFGSREEAVIGKACYEITHHRSDVCAPPDDPCPLLNTVETGDHSLVEHMHYTPDNKKIYVEVSTSPIKDAEGKVNQVIHVERDITERKYAENTILRSQQTMQAILSSMPYGVVIIGKDKKIRSANEAALKLMNYDSEKQIVGMTCNHTLCPAQEGKCPILDMDQKLDKAERMLLTKDGKSLPILKTVVPVEIGGEEVLLEAFIDITEQKNAANRLKNYSEEMEQINEELKNFAYIVSHDLRAPLVNIKGFSDELVNTIKEFSPLLERHLDRFDGGEKRIIEGLLKKDIPEAIGFIDSSVTRMDTLINSILKLSRLGRNELKPELLHTENLVHTILKSLAHQIEVHKARVSVGPLPDIVIDKTAAEQIFSNLLDNALKYLEPGRAGKIDVFVEKNAQETIFTVRDNGRGIAEEDTQKVFELFRRVGKRDVPGEGMGLAYVTTLVRRLGGRIWCESELGAGTTFRFTVPLSVPA